MGHVVVVLVVGADAAVVLGDRVERESRERSTQNPISFISSLLF